MEPFGTILGYVDIDTDKNIPVYSCNYNKSEQCEQCEQL